MKKLLAATTFVIAASASAAGADCGGHDSMATATPPDQMGAAPAATQAPNPAVAKALTPKAVKPKQTQQAKQDPKAPAPDAKVKLVSAN